MNDLPIIGHTIPPFVLAVWNRHIGLGWNGTESVVETCSVSETLVALEPQATPEELAQWMIPDAVYTAAGWKLNRTPTQVRFRVSMGAEP